MPNTDPLELAAVKVEPIFGDHDPDWTNAKLKRAYEEIEKIAIDELSLDIYPVRIEIITSEQMLDEYSSVGLPLMYRHWSFGKRFAYHDTLYRKGLAGLAYEIVINSNPCIAYLMEENSMTMQTLVIAHAGMGHNHFFKNNYLFRQWTDAEGILDYLKFAQDYVRMCEEKHGRAEVERVLDAAHALMAHGVDRYGRHHKPNLKEEKARLEDRAESLRLAYNAVLDADIFKKAPPEEPSAEAKKEQEQREKLRLPEENLLYFIEKRAPNLEDWQRELVRIVRMVSQYFYPQKQLQMMNEGCACFVHYRIMHRLHEKGLITEGNMLEFLHSHSSVVFQPGFDDPRFGGINPYALGFAMMQDIYGICTGHEDLVRQVADGDTKAAAELKRRLAEDQEWFPEIAGNGDPMGTLLYAWANYRDESFILQYLSPRVIRHFRMFTLDDNNSKSALKVEAIHNEPGYRRIRSALSKQYDLSRREPDIQVVDVKLLGDRTLTLEHVVHDDVLLEEKSCKAVIEHAKTLWGYPVELKERGAEKGDILKTY
ncbi:MAG: SpoVR family protein [bacterium]|nr:SpoVR family protein [bacterium]